MLSGIAFGQTVTAHHADPNYKGAMDGPTGPPPGADAPFQLLSNPSPGNYVFLVAVAPSSQVKLNVLDDKRRSVANSEIQVSENVSQVAVTVQNAPAGVYYVTLITSTGTYVKQVVVP